jgi:hypothetical protein
VIPVNCWLFSGGNHQRSRQKTLLPIIAIARRFASTAWVANGGARKEIAFEADQDGFKVLRGESKISK